MGVSTMSRVVVITGANSGIGKAAVHKFAQADDTVIMACRNIEKSKPIWDELRNSYKQANLILLHLDLSSFASIKQFVQTFQNEYEKLDVLIHNAAYLKHGERTHYLNEEGIELAFATNVIGPHLLSELLLSSLNQATNPVILHACTTNIKHFFDPKRKIDFESIIGKLSSNKSFSSYKQYGDSKMALWLLTQQLAEQAAYHHIRVNALQINRVRLSPETISNLTPMYRLLAKLQYVISQTPEQMAQLYYDICTNERYAKETGKLINHLGKVMKPAQHNVPNPIQLIHYLKSNDYYPAYGSNKQHMNTIWDISQQATKSYL